jgi:hypothetical protein
VPNGAFSTGNFGLLAETVFSTDAPAFEFQDETSSGGRSRVQFRFDVTRDRSPLRLQHGNRHALTGFRGFFTSGAEDLDVDLLEIDTESIPPELGMVQGREQIEYGRSRIGDSDYLLLKASDVMLFDTDGQISRNHIRFDNCREYTGRSTISFGDSEAPPPALPSTAESQPLPANIELHVRLTAPVKRGITAVGDVISGKITKLLRSPVAIAQGSAVSFRVIRMEIVPVGSQVFQVVRLQLLGVETNGRKYDAAGTLERVKNPSSYWGALDGRISFSGTKQRIEPGLEMVWSTTAGP